MRLCLLITDTFHIQMTAVRALIRAIVLAKQFLPTAARRGAVEINTLCSRLKTEYGSLSLACIHIGGK